MSPPVLYGRRLRPEGRGGLVLLGLLAVLQSVAAAQSPAALPAVRTVPLPLRELERLVPADVQPLKQSEFEALLDAARQASERSPTLLRAEYSATLAGDVLRDGEFVATVQGSSKTARALDLSPFRVALRELSWSDRDAVWGQTAPGRTELLVDRAEGNLRGRWELRGRRLSQIIEFTLDVLPATVSRLKLRIPDTLTLSTAGNLIVATESDPQEGWTVWRIELGNRTQCQLTVSPTADKTLSRPRMYYQQTLMYAVRPEGLRFQADLDLEVFHAPLREVEFEVDSTLQIYAASYGPDLMLPLQESPGPNGKRIAVTLPDPLLGQGRTLHLKGLARVNIDRMWKLPTVRVKDAHLATGTLTLQVQHPLEVKDFRTDGCRQSAVDTSASQEKFEFRLLHGNASVEVLLGTPALRIAARVSTDVQTSKENWSCVSRIDWTALSGSTFSLDCQIPPEWEVTDIRSDASSPQGDLVRGDVVTQPDGSRVLKLAFLESLSADRPKRVEISARRLPVPPDQQTAVPAFVPLHAHDLKMLVSIGSDSTVRPVLEPETTFDPVLPENLPAEWAQMEFWRFRIDRRNPVPLLLQLTDALPDGDFYLQSLQTPIDVIMNVRAEFETGRLSERFDLWISPQHGRTERVLVYLTEAGPPVNWVLEDLAAVPLSAKKLPAVRHAAWDLPLAGELWEIRLSTPQAVPFVISGARSRGVSAIGRVGLAFVPQANSFTGELVVEHSHTGVQFESKDLEPRHDEQRAVANGQLPGEEVRRALWTYTDSTAALEFRIPEDQASTGALSIPRLLLETRLVLEDDGLDVYRAQYHLGENFVASAFSWSLPEEATLLSASLDDRPHPVSQESGRYQLAGGGPARPRTLEILYMVPSRRQFGMQHRRIVVPQVNAPVLEFDWQVAVPPGVWIGDLPAGAERTGATFDFSWQQRLLGPLGRPRHHPRFNPFRTASWKSLFAASASGRDEAESSTTTQPAVEHGRSLISESGWKVSRLTAPVVPQQLSIEIWDGRQATVLAWVGTLASLLLGIGLRIFQVPGRGRCGLFLLTASIVLAVSLTPVLGQIFGGCFLGTLLAMLIPRRMLEYAFVNPPPAPSIPPGSTQSYNLAPGMFSALLIGLLITSHAWAQEPAAGTPRSPAPAKDANAASATSFDVYLPVNESGAPLGADPLVYAPSKLLQLLDARQAEVTRLAPYYLNRASYRATIDATGQAVMDAEYEVFLPVSVERVPVHFPLTNVNLGFDDACTVNGQPHAVFNDPARRGLTIYLGGHPSTVAAAEPVDGDRPPPPALPTASSAGTAVQTYRVRFHLHPIVTPAEGGGSLRVGIPAIPAARLEAGFSDSQSVIELSESRGEIQVTADRKHLDADLGEVSQIQLRWSRQTPRVSPRTRAEVSANGLIDIQPTLIRAQYRIQYQVHEGRIDSLRWKLPQQVSIRSISAPGLFNALPRFEPDKPTEVRLNFSQPQERTFVVNLEFAVPNRGGPNSILLPPLPTFVDEGDAADLRLVHHHFAVRTPSEFQLDTLADGGEHVSPVTVEAFLQGWGTEGSRPQAAYKLLDPVPLTFQIHPLLPSRVVRSNVTALIGDRRLDWTLTANVSLEANAAAAFQHQIEIDPRLQVVSVSVQEDSANRLLRWSRVGNRLVLYLRDKTFGTQTVTITGSMAVQVPQEFTLPDFRFVDATLADARLVLYQAAELSVEVDEMTLLERLEPLPEQRQGPRHSLLIGRFRRPADSPPLVVRTARNDPELTCDAVTTLQARDARWRMTTSLLFQVRRGHGSRFMIRIPPELPQFEIEAEDVRRLQERDADGALQVSLLPNQPIRDQFLVTIRSSINLPGDVQWRVPEISPVNATLSDSYLVVAPAETFDVGETHVSGLAPTALPQELERLLPTAELLNVKSAVYRGETRPWHVSAARKLVTDRNAGVLLAESQFWFDPEMSLTGRTSLIVLPSEIQSLKLRLPDSCQVRAVLVNGRANAFQLASDQQLAIPLHTPQLGQIVTVCWTRAATSRIDWAGQTGLDLPQPEGLPVLRTMVMVVPPPGYTLQPEFGLATEEPASLGVRRAEALIELIRVQAEAGQTVHDPEWWLAVQETARLLHELGTHEGVDSSHQRFVRTLLEELKQLAGPLDRESLTRLPNQEADAMSAILLPHPLLDSEPQIVTGRLLSDSPLQFRLVRQTLWDLGRGLLAGLLVAVAGWRLIRLLRDSRWFRDPVVTWILLAVIWWLWLTPVWVAAAMLLAAAVHAVLRLPRHSRSESSVSVIVPSR